MYGLQGLICTVYGVGMHGVQGCYARVRVGMHGVQGYYVRYTGLECTMYRVDIFSIHCTRVV